MIGLSCLPKKPFGTLMSIESAIAALSGLVLLGERLAPLQWLAIGTIVAASAGSTTTAIRADDEKTQGNSRIVDMPRDPEEHAASVSLLEAGPQRAWAARGGRVVLPPGVLRRVGVG